MNRSKLLILWISMGTAFLGLNRSDAYEVPRGISVKPQTLSSEDDLMRIKSWGVNFVRVTMSNSQFLDSKPPYSFNEESFKMLKTAVTSARDKGFRVMIDPHAFPGQARPFTMMPNDPFWTDLKYHDQVVRVWKRLANEYKDEGEYLEYDLMNEPIMFENAEPGSSQDYLGLIQRLITTIREIDKKHTIHVEAAAVKLSNGRLVPREGSFKYFGKFEDPNLVYDFHMYSPLEFTHFGINKKYSMRKYPGKDSKGIYWDKDQIKKAMAGPLEFSKKNKVPILVGEFSASRLQGDSGLRWMKDCLDIFEESGWGWVYHTYRPGETAWDAELTSEQKNRERSEMAPRISLLKAYWKCCLDQAPKIPEFSESDRQDKHVEKGKMDGDPMVE